MAVAISYCRHSGRADTEAWNEASPPVNHRLDRHKEAGRFWSIGVAVLLFVMFLIGVSDRGQRYLVGQPSTDHWQRDDQYMGAGLAPYVYCLAPGTVFTVFGLILFLMGRKRE